MNLLHLHTDWADTLLQYNIGMNFFFFVFNSQDISFQRMEGTAYLVCPNSLSLRMH